MVLNNSYTKLTQGLRHRNILEKLEILNKWLSEIKFWIFHYNTVIYGPLEQTVAVWWRLLCLGDENHQTLLLVAVEEKSKAPFAVSKSENKFTDREFSLSDVSHFSYIHIISQILVLSCLVFLQCVPPLFVYLLPVLNSFSFFLSPPFFLYSTYKDNFPLCCLAVEVKSCMLFHYCILNCCVSLLALHNEWM